MLPVLLLALSAQVLAADSYVFDRSVEVVRDYYLFREELVPSVLLEKAARGAEDAIPWLFVDAGPEGVTLKSADGTQVGKAAATSWKDLPAALLALREGIRASGQPLPEGLNLDQAILLGLVSALDRYSGVMDARAAEKSKEKSSGQYSGIGIRDRNIEGEVSITEVCPYGPAHQAGVKPEDRIVTIDGVPTLGMGDADVTGRLRGPVGSRVVLGIQRGSEALTLTVVRANVHWPDGSARVLDSGMAYVGIETFTQQTEEWLAGELYALRRSGALDRGVVLDLRGNTGGPTRSCVWVADQFLSKGLIFSDQYRDPDARRLKRRFQVASRKGLDPVSPIVILVDEKTASASERLAMALVANERAIVVGSTTVGKSTAWKTWYVGDNLSLRITNAQAVFARGMTIPAEGIVPDVAVNRMDLQGSGISVEPVLGEPRWRITWVSEGKDWRPSSDEGVDNPKDFALDLASQVLLETGAGGRKELLAAITRVLPGLQAREDLRFGEAMMAHGIPWKSDVAQASGGSPDQLVARIVPVSDVRSGGKVDVEVILENHGAVSAEEARVEVVAPQSPLNGFVLPVGTVPGGQTGRWQGTVDLSFPERTRTDQVRLRVRTANGPPMDAGQSLVTLTSETPPPYDLRVRLDPSDGTKLRFTVENQGDIPIEGLKARLDFPDPKRIQVLDSTVSLAEVPARGRGEGTMALRVLENGPGETLPLDLCLDMKGRGARCHHLDVPVDGTDVLSHLPWARWEPLATGPVDAETTLRIRVTDDDVPASIVIWHEDRKSAYFAGTSTDAVLEVPLRLVEGSNEVRARVIDAQGHEYSTRMRVWGGK